MTEPDRLFPVNEEVAKFRGYFDDPALVLADYQAAADKAVFRNDLITTRMYIVDMEYTVYEGRLIHEAQSIDFWTKVVSTGLSTTAGLVPVVATKNTLTETAAAVNTLDSVYNDKVLRNKMIQNVQASMRIARHEQAAVLYANMKCSILAYPLGMALSDLETYYRAGTFHTGLMKLVQTVSKAESDAKATQESNKPAPSVDALAKLRGNATEAAVKANTGNGSIACTNGLGPLRPPALLSWKRRLPL